MIAAFFPPTENAESIVNGKLALAFQQAGWDIQVVSRPIVARAGHQYTSDWTEPWLPLRPISTYIDCGILETAMNVSRSLLEKRVPKAFTALRRAAELNWARRAARWAVKQHRRRPFDLVLSRSYPEASHLAAMWMVRKTGVKWVANWNDPTAGKYPAPYGPGPAGKLGRAAARILGDVAKEASWHTFPSEPLRQYVADYMPSDIRPRSSVIPHIALDLLQPPPQQQGTEMILCHNGDLRLPRDPDSFFEGLSMFVRERPEPPKLRLVICGHCDEHAKRSAQRWGVESYVQILGPRSYLESQRVLAGAAAALLVEAPCRDAVFLPSKLADYVTLDKPVLAVTPPNSAAAQLLNEHGGGVVAACGDPQAAGGALRRLYESWLGGRLMQEMAPKKLHDVLGPQSVLEAYRELLPATDGHATRSG